MVKEYNFDPATWTNTKHPFSDEKLRETFKSPYDKEKAHNGKKFIWLGLSSQTDFPDMIETGPYYRIRFEDGIEIDADPIEIYENVGMVGGVKW